MSSAKNIASVAKNNISILIYRNYKTTNIFITYAIILFIFIICGFLGVFLKKQFINNLEKNILIEKLKISDDTSAIKKQSKLILLYMNEVHNNKILNLRRTNYIGPGMITLDTISYINKANNIIKKEDTNIKTVVKGFYQN